MSSSNKSYPAFTKEIYAVWFKHWLVNRYEHHKQDCINCLAVNEVIVFGTRLLLDSLFAEKTRFLEGSNTIGIYVGMMSKEHAKYILHSYPHIASFQDIGQRQALLQKELNNDFPGMKAHTLKSYSHSIINLFEKNGQSLYKTLSGVYKTAMKFDYDTSLPPIAVVEYVLLCFHLNKQLLLTASTASRLWAETLRYDVILLLHDLLADQHDAVECALQSFPIN